MPGIHITVSGAADTHLTAQLAERLTTVTCEVLKKERERTRVIVQYVPPEQWFIAGTLLATDGRKSFALNVTITEHTNTRSEVAQFHKAAFALLTELLGPVHPHSSIHVQNCEAIGYGYGGITQESRYQHA